MTQLIAPEQAPAGKATTGESNPDATSSSWAFSLPCLPAAFCAWLARMAAAGRGDDFSPLLLRVLVVLEICKTRIMAKGAIQAWAELDQAALPSCAAKR
jgi:hypothetical protein